MWAVHTMLRTRGALGCADVANQGGAADHGRPPEPWEGLPDGLVDTSRARARAGLCSVLAWLREPRCEPHGRKTSSQGLGVGW